MADAVQAYGGLNGPMAVRMASACGDSSSGLAKDGNG